MFIGTVPVREKSYRTEYRHPFGDVSIFDGWVDRPHGHYQCEHCGHDHYLIGEPQERFFCGSCGRLVGIAAE